MEEVRRELLHVSKEKEKEKRSCCVIRLHKSLVKENRESWREPKGRPYQIHYKGTLARECDSVQR